MNILLTVLEVVAPVFLLGAIGFTWVKSGHDYQVEFVTRLCMTLSVPCLIFTSLMHADIDARALGTLTIASFAAYGALIAIMAMLIFALKLDRATYLPALTMGNTGNLGLPLALFAFGQTGLSYAIIVFAVSAVIQYSFGIWAASGGTSVKKLATEPLVIFTLLGALFLWNDWETPAFLTNTLELVGQIAIPIMLITLGVAVAKLEISAYLKPALLSFFKLFVSIAIGFLVSKPFGLGQLETTVLVLQLATPMAVSSYLIAEKFNSGPDEVAGLVVISTIISIVSIPLLLTVLI